MNTMLAIGRETKSLISSSSLTLKKIYAVKNEATVGFLVKNYKQEKVQALYMMLLIECSMLCESNFTGESLSSTVRFLISEYPQIRPQEMILVLKNGLSGKYGKTYGKVSCQEVLRWASEFFDERLTFFENRIAKVSTDWRDLDPEILKTASPFQERMQEVKQEKKIKNEIDVIVQGWIKEFDKMYDAQNRDSLKKVPMRFIDYGGSKINIDEFLEGRMKELNIKK